MERRVTGGNRDPFLLTMVLSHMTSETFEMRRPHPQTTCLAVVLAALLSFPQWSEAAKFNRVLDIGDKAPAWSDLPGTDGRSHSLDEHRKAKAVIVVFTCNHCPVAKAYEQRLIDIARKAKKQQVATVAISVSLYEADNLQAMTRIAAERKYPFQYIHDASQKIGKKYGALCTPHVFLLDGERKVAYMGKIDDSMYPRKVTEQLLQSAISQVLAGKPVDIDETKPVGCPIDFKP